MPTLQAQQIARALLVHGISGEIVHSPADGVTVIVDDERQLEAAADVIAKHFPGLARVVPRPSEATAP